MRSGFSSRERGGNSFAEAAGLKRFARVARANHPGREVVCDDGAGADDRAVADGDAGVNEGFGGDPRLVGDGDGTGDEREAGFFVIVRAGAKVGALADDNAATEADG